MCDYCGGTGIDPECTADVVPGEAPCDPPHACYRCYPDTMEVSDG